MTLHFSTGEIHVIHRRENGVKECVCETYKIAMKNYNAKFQNNIKIMFFVFQMIPTKCDKWNNIDKIFEIIRILTKQVMKEDLYL